MTAIEPGSRAAFLAAGTERALAMDNRGPLRFTDDGVVHPDILAAYRETGFYVFEQVIGPEELAEARADIDAVLDRAPYPTTPRRFFGSPVTPASWPWPRR